MAREIKFRAWEENDKKMYGWEDCCGPLDFTLSDVGAGDNMIWMQFTGLKDKNGREIYEGDVLSILQSHSYSPDPHVPAENFHPHAIVEWLDAGRWIVKWTAPKSEALLLHLGVFDELGRFIINNNLIEVIGNIYQNPELLESPTSHDSERAKTA